MFRIIRLILALLVLPFLVMPSIQAQTFYPPPPYLQVILDKSYYYPGDAGKLTIDIKNILSYSIEVFNLSVSFPWVAFINGHWDGNQTLPLNKTIASGAWLPTINVNFNVPGDSRFSNYPPYYQGQVRGWASGIGPGGSIGAFTAQFYVGSPYFSGIYADWHYIYLLLIGITALLGVIAGSVVFYIYTGRRQRQALHWGAK